VIERRPELVGDEYGNYGGFGGIWRLEKEGERCGDVFATFRVPPLVAGGQSDGGGLWGELTWRAALQGLGCR